MRGAADKARSAPSDTTTTSNHTVGVLSEPPKVQLHGSGAHKWPGAHDVGGFAGQSLRSIMAKKAVGFVKLQIPAGKANPAPPVGTALGPQGINIMAFCKEFNARTQGQDTILPVEITIYADKSFSFITKTPPAAVLLKKEAGVEKGSGTPNRVKVGSVTKAQIRKIAEIKLPDLNTESIEGAMAMVAGAARSMGIEVRD